MRAHALRRKCVIEYKPTRPRAHLFLCLGHSLRGASKGVVDADAQFHGDEAGGVGSDTEEGVALADVVVWAEAEDEFGMGGACFWGPGGGGGCEGVEGEEGGGEEVGGGEDLDLF
ncbi:hypothetical protein IAQ61_010739 [Plenodomus lingam]|uniref:uncharacterized protein n=1 Tax=Leptosphaeria maculans TaxID=5022 RepID=UPI00331A8B3D|nr:hypothetical protein IAQ61_010739 [Plenodomus lingam]